MSVIFDEMWLSVPGGYAPTSSSTHKPLMSAEDGLALQQSGLMWWSDEYGCWLVKRENGMVAQQIIEFTSPVNPNTNVVLSDGWFDATGFAKWYERGIHPGHDLNKNTPVWNTDAGMPVYSIGDGKVTCSQHFKVWGWVIVIDHTTPQRTLMSRYAHVLSTPDKVKVSVGDVVKRGQIIAYIGNADGTQADHLHVDLSPTPLLKAKPNYWPTTEDDVYTYFIDMIKFLIEQGQTEQPPMALTFKKFKNVHTQSVNVRTLPTTASVASVVSSTPKGGVVDLVEQLPRFVSDGYEWAAMSDGRWTAVKPVNGKEWFTPFP